MAIIAYGLLPLNCKCYRVIGTAYEFDWIVIILWARLGLGMVLGEAPRKIWTYFVLLFVMTGLTVFVFESVMPH